jgi:hypothetical protein
MAGISGIREHMEVIGADGVHVGTVDKLEGDRIKLTKKDSGQGSHQGHHHYLSTGLVADVEGDRVRLSTTGANALLFREEGDQGTDRLVSQSSPSQSQYRSQPSPTPAPRRSNPQQGAKSSRLPLALGVAAIAAAGGAALFAKRRPSETQDFELRLQTDESLRLISSAKVEGTPVVGRDGEHLGKIENFMVDKYTGRVAYAVLSFGGTFGFGEHLFPLPWSILTYDEDKDGYVLNLSKDQLERAPKFTRSDAPEFTADYRLSVAQAYGRSGQGQSSSS